MAASTPEPIPALTNAIARSLGRRFPLEWEPDADELEVGASAIMGGEYPQGWQTAAPPAPPQRGPEPDQTPHRHDAHGAHGPGRTRSNTLLTPPATPEPQHTSE